MRRETDFEWDEANIGHLARHSVLSEEAEQVILNDPVDAGGGGTLSKSWRDSPRPRSSRGGRR